MSLGKEWQRRNESVNRVRDVLYGRDATMTLPGTHLAYLMAIEPQPANTPANCSEPRTTNIALDMVMREDFLFRTKVCPDEIKLWNELDDETPGNQPNVVVLAGPNYGYLNDLRARIMEMHPSLPVAIFAFTREGVGTPRAEDAHSIAQRIIYVVCDALSECGVLSAHTKT